MIKNIKKLLAIMLAIATIVCMSSITASAANTSNIQVTVNDTLVTFPDAKPYIDENSRTLIPVRFVTEALGADVSWIQATQTAVIEKDGTKVEITIGKKDIKVTKDGTTQTVTMDTAAVNKENRTFVPIRFVAEALGAYVDFSNLYRVVEIVMPDEVTADEMKRLRAYPMNQTIDLASRNNEANAWWVNREEYKSFIGNFWFSNSHFFLVTLEQKLGFDVKSQYRGTKITKGANALDFARYAVQFADDEMSMELYTMGTMMMIGNWNDGDCQTVFRTDNALCYQQVSPPQAIVSVRGILEYTPETDRGLTILKVQFGEENPVIGKTYTYDIEVQVSVNSRNFLDASHVYWLKPDGTAVAVAPYTTK